MARVAEINVIEIDHLQTLQEREAYLRARIAAKKSVGWETEYDVREQAALIWAIERLTTPLFSREN
jgi:hypothetical protein